MKIHTETTVLEHGGVEDNYTFGMQSNARSFSILSNNLYRFKIRAVIRELSCNALDSHVAAGRPDVPFEVHLPNAMEPYLEIRDQGVGLSHDQVINIFTIYFVSTKHETNDQIGGLGLGGKAPFAYTNNWTVTAVKNGMSCSYAMVINKDGIPAPYPMGTIKTDAHDGVTIRVPVKNEDFEKFCEEAQNVFRWFDRQPIVTGNRRYKLKPIDRVPMFEGTSWFMMNGDYYDRLPSGAIMGNVLYPIRAENVHRRFYSLLENKVILRFEIGELDFQPSREELNYDPVTLKVLEARLDQVLREMRIKAETHFASCNTLWEARCAARDLERHHTATNVLRMLSSSGHNLMWKGQEIGETNYMDWSSSGLFSKENPAPTVYVTNETVRAKSVTRISASSSAVFVIADCSDASSRCRKKFYGGNKRTYLISGADQQVKQLVEWLGNPDTIKASSLDKADRKIMKFKGRTWTGRRSYHGHNKINNWSNETDITVLQGGYYVTVLHNDPVDDEGHQILLESMINSARNLNIITGECRVWGLNKTNTKLVKDLKNWVDFGKFFRAEVEKKIASANMSYLMLTQHELCQLEGRLRGSVALWSTHFSSMTNSLGKLTRDWKAAHDSIRGVNVDGLRGAVGLLNLSLADKKGTPPDLISQLAQVIKDYPMIKYAGTVMSHTDITELVNYVTLVDKA